jgi:uncharacterized protein
MWTMDGPVVDNECSEGQPACEMPARLSMVVLSARNLPALRSFYFALGWPERPGGSDALAIFQLGDTGLALYPQTTEASEASGMPPEERPVVTLVVGVETSGEVDTAFAAAVRAGARPVVEPQDQRWGGRSGVLADPEGNRWEVLFVPRPNPTEQGSLTDTATDSP